MMARSGVGKNRLTGSRFVDRPAQSVFLWLGFLRLPRRRRGASQPPTRRIHVTIRGVSICLEPDHTYFESLT